MSILVCTHATPVGDLTLVADEAGLRGLYFPQHKVGGPPKDARSGESTVLKRARAQLDAYFAGNSATFDLPLSLHGTPFQQSVWRALQAIPFGGTTTYGALARKIGAPAAVRALGAAVGRNPVSIIVPCHRVVGASGALTGFAGGIERKRMLLALEAERAARAA